MHGHSTQVAVVLLLLLLLLLHARKYCYFDPTLGCCVRTLRVDVGVLVPFPTVLILFALTLTLLTLAQFHSFLARL